MDILQQYIVYISRADMCLNRSLSVKSTKIGTNIVFNELIKMRYGDTGTRVVYA